MSQKECTVPTADLLIAPYLHPWGSDIFVQVAALNSKGISLYSADGGGAIILTAPDAPHNLVSDPAVSNASEIKITWEQGANGGAAISMYRVHYDQGSGTGQFVVLATGITELTYTATGLTAGKTYKFKVQSRNSFSYSAYSDEVAVLAAQTPVKPAAPTTSAVGDNVVISWTAPFANGSPILSYTVYIETVTAGVFAIDSANCDGAIAQIRDA